MDATQALLQAHAAGLAKESLRARFVRQRMTNCWNKLCLADYLAIVEMERVGRQGYLMLESYRNEQELFNLQCWALTAESFFDVSEWIWLYKKFGYNGDYEFIFFE